MKKNPAGSLGIQIVRKKDFSSLKYKMDEVAITLSDNSFQTIMQSIYFLFDIIKNSNEDPSHPPTIVLVTSILIMYRTSLGLEY